MRQWWGGGGRGLGLLTVSVYIYPKNRYKYKCFLYFYVVFVCNFVLIFSSSSSLLTLKSLNKIINGTNLFLAFLFDWS